MTVIVYFDSEDMDYSYQFSNLSFGGIVSLAEDQQVDAELLRLLNQGDVMHGVQLNDYSIETQLRLADFMEQFLLIVMIRTSDADYLEHMAEFSKILNSRWGSFKTNFAYLNESERFEL